MSNAKVRHRRRRRLYGRWRRVVVLQLPVPASGIPEMHIGSTLESLFEELGETEELRALIVEKWGHLF